MGTLHNEVEGKGSRGRHFVKERFLRSRLPVSVFYLFSAYGCKHIVQRKLYYAHILEFGEPQMPHFDIHFKKLS